MLDLDTLAQKRAQSVNQGEEAWKSVLWGTSFQRLSQSMSDGEIVGLLQACPSVEHLQKVLAFIDTHPGVAIDSPYKFLLIESEKAGMDLEEWITEIGGRP